MGLTRITTSASILSTDALKEHLRIDVADPSMTAAHLAAVDLVERQTNTQLGPGSFVLTLDEFPWDRSITLPRPPLAAVQVVSYTDPAGDVQTLDPATYRVDTSERPGQIILRSGQSWPATSPDGGAVRIEYTAGYPLDSAPESLVAVVRLVTGAFYELREGAIDRRYDELPLPFSVTSLIQWHRFEEVA